MNENHWTRATLILATLYVTIRYLKRRPPQLAFHPLYRRRMKSRNKVTKRCENDFGLSHLGFTNH